MRYRYFELELIMKKFSILIVEDEARVQTNMSSELIKTLPIDMDLDFKFCDNLVEAIQLIHAEAFDLISVDGRFREGAPGSIFNSSAGIHLIDVLYKINFPGHVVFYSGNDRQVDQIRSALVAGRPVNAFAKSIGFGEDKWAREVTKLLAA